MRISFRSLLISRGGRTIFFWKDFDMETRWPPYKTSQSMNLVVRGLGDREGHVAPLGLSNWLTETGLKKVKERGETTARFRMD